MAPEEHQATEAQLRPEPRPVDLPALVARITASFDRPARNIVDRYNEEELS